jgi:hypothetical protein
MAIRLVFDSLSHVRGALIMAKRLMFATAWAALLLVGLLSGLFLALPGRSFREAMEEGFGPLLDQPQTRFAPAFREEVFRSFDMGSTQPQILKALGPPLGRRYCSDKTVCWDYSTAASSDASHFVRALIFDSSGRLVHRHMGFVLGD